MTSSFSQFQQLCADFRRACSAGEAPAIEDFLTLVDDGQKDDLLAQLIPIQIERTIENGDTPDPTDYEKYGGNASQIFRNVIEATTAAATSTNASPPYASAKTVASKTVIDEESNHSFEVDQEQLGPYTLIRQIGRGGMGAVWEAQQTTPVSRRVAIKLVRSDLETDDTIARFELERKAISCMDHPNIARVLDAGNAEDGRPYFVMELVKGKQIDRFCDEKQLTIRQRIELMVPVCKAIQHAHQKGIIHRDLKPSNVLVVEIDGVMTPKVIDFGVAKALEQTKLLDKDTGLTTYGQVVGTLQYMSPEQSQGRDVDTRTDIYGLGALMYRLLTGSFPVNDVQGGSYVTFAEQLREYDAPRLSSRFHEKSEAVESVCKARRTSVEKLRQELRGDLEWVVGKAVEREQKMRYQTAQELAVDLEHYLRDEEVEARPHSAVYRIQKFVRRNQYAVLSAASIVGLLIVGIVGTSYGMLEAWRAEARAKKSEALAQDEAALARKEQAEKEELQIMQQQQLEAVRLKSAWSSWQLGNVSRAWQQMRELQNQTAWEGDYLHAEFNAMDEILYGHTSQVMAVACSPDGTRIATGGMDHTVRIVDAKSLETIRRVNVEAAVVDLEFSPDSQTLFVTDLGNRFSRIDGDGEVTASEKQAGDLGAIAILAGLDGSPILAIAESSVDSVKDGLQWVSTPVGTPRIRLIRSEDFSSFQTLASHEEKITALAADSAGLRLVSSDESGRVILWQKSDEGEFEELRRFELGFKVTDVKPIASGEKLLIAGEDSTLRMLDQNGAVLRVFVGHDDAVAAIEVDEIGQRFVSVGRDKTARVWDFDGTLVVQCRGHFAALNDVAFIAKGRRIVTVSDDSTAAVWSAEANPTTRSVHAFKELAWSAAFSADGSRIAAVSEDGRIQLRSARDLSLVKEVDTGAPLLCVEFSPNANFVVHAGTEGGLTVRDGSDLSEIQTWEAHDGYVWDVSFSKDGKSLVSVGGDKVARIWSVANWKLERELVGHSAELASACFSSDNRFVVTAGDDRTVRLWNRQSGKELFSFVGHKNIIWKVAISKDEKRIVSSGYDGEVFIWDLAGRKKERVFRAHQDQIAGLCISSDGDRIVTASDDKSIRVWDVNSGIEMFELRDPGESHIVHVGFSPDGRKLISGNSQGWLTLRTASNKSADTDRFLQQQAIAFGIHGLNDVSDTNASEDELRKLLAEAALCCDYFPGYQVLTIRGVAESRLGMHDQAVLTLKEAARLEVIEYGEPDVRPFIEAYLAVSLVHLGRLEEAIEQQEIFLRKRNDPALQFDPAVKQLEEMIELAIRGESSFEAVQD